DVPNVREPFATEQLIGHVQRPLATAGKLEEPQRRRFGRWLGADPARSKPRDARDTRRRRSTQESAAPQNMHDAFPPRDVRCSEDTMSVSGPPDPESAYAMAGPRNREWLARDGRPAVRQEGVDAVNRREWLTGAVATGAAGLLDRPEHRLAPSRRDRERS